MTYNPQHTLEPQLNENISFPREWDEFLNFNTKLIKTISRKVNSKDRGDYLDEEIVNDQRFFNAANRQTVHNIFRKVVDCGALPNAGLKQVAHGLVGIDNNWFLTRIYGTAQEPAGVAPRPYFIPLPNAGPNYQVQLMVDTTNINITTAVNLAAFTQSYVILEFWKV